jgi:hypothetical protein
VAAVFIFSSDGDLDVFPSLQAAEGYMEAVDVAEGREYAAAFLHDGTVVRIGVDGERVVLKPSDTRDAARLDQSLNEYQRRIGAAARSGSALDYANDWFRAEWELRWPKRPAWLARRLHGDQPTRVTNALQ